MDITLPYKWIKEYIKTNLDAKEFAKALSVGGPSIERWNYNENLDDYLLDIEVTPNRADMASVVGIAREANAILGGGLIDRTPKINPNVSTPLPLEIKVENKELCPRYQAVVIKGVKVGKSPQWLIDRLEALEMNSHSNVVDITNYVMLEYGQPTHVFDYDKIEGSKIIVRNAKKGEMVTTLGGGEHELQERHLVIADAKDPIALGAVKGGTKAEVDDNTMNIVIEAANFEPYSTRKMARDFGLHTDAASLFEKGLNSYQTSPAIHRIIELILELAGGEVASEILDSADEFKSRVINFDPKLSHRMLGVEIPTDEIIITLERLQFDCKVSGDSIEVTVPYFRLSDVIEDYDLVEEIARIYGYDNIPSILPEGKLPAIHTSDKYEWEDRIRDYLASIGMTEVFPYAMVSDKHLELTKTEPKDVIELMNPLTSDFVYMKTDLVSDVIMIAEKNEEMEDSLMLFQVDQIFLPTEKNSLPTEQSNLSMLVNGNNKKEVFYDLKGKWEYVLSRIGIDLDSVNYEPISKIEPFASGTSAEIKIEGKSLGYIGTVSKHAMIISGIKKATAILEVNFDVLYEIIGETVKSYSEIPKYPAVMRDVSILIDSQTTWQSIKDEVSKTSGELLESIELFDTYEGKGIPTGKKSIAFNLTFRSSEKTLDETDVEKIMEAVTKLLESDFEATIR